MGSGEPMVLLHGVMGSERHWQEVAPLLADHFDVIALTALGHRGGPPPDHRPVTIADLIDRAERQLDDLSLDRVHLAGNSMGGWMALELARRGRALSVCALSPAGFWGDSQQAPSSISPRVRRLREARLMGRLTRPILPLMLRTTFMRRFGLRNVAVNGSRVSPQLALQLTDDMLGCLVADDLLATHEYFSLLDPPPCPITIAWSQPDRILPESITRPYVAERLPGAHYIPLPNVGHVPMLDDPPLVARLIAESAASPPVTDPTHAAGHGERGGPAMQGAG